jgi:hypothetical protein
MSKPQVFTIGKLLCYGDVDTELHLVGCVEYLDPDPQTEADELGLHYAVYTDLDECRSEWTQSEWNACLEICDECKPLG